ncbi:DUF6948 domain-containing protein [Pseudochelatococcus contaminans]|uniref:DUF6948 domain-containing protein n=1 Tax=Pseudochelatococcus contaminans TaxID=1538103 RepID=A0A7W5Z365_9HYPH|nr:hypothetical protein [Pseudochelatococcus contaminans]MBB3808786.1 hypothetical protein [Pseudochelatococcus contaminans]
MTSTVSIDIDREVLIRAIISGDYSVSPTAPVLAAAASELVAFEPPASPLIGQHVVIRTYSAGVHFGTLIAKDGTNVLLRDARRLYRWSGAFTLSEVATKGVGTESTRIAAEIPFIELTQAIEIIPTTEVARATFAKIHEPSDE